MPQYHVSIYSPAILGMGSDCGCKLLAMVVAASAIRFCRLLWNVILFVLFVFREKKQRQVVICEVQQQIIFAVRLHASLISM